MRPDFDAIPAQCVKIPDHVTYQAAALAEPLAVCLHAVARAGDVSGKRAVMFGAGPIGLLTMLAAQRAGIAETTVVDIAAAPLAFATRLGANHVVDISGGDEALKAEAAARRSTWRSKSRERPRALPAPSAPSGAAASWFRSAICRAGRSRCRRTP